MYCPKCGQQNKDGARFCAFCGEPLGGNSTAQNSGQGSGYSNNSPYDSYGQGNGYNTSGYDYNGGGYGGYNGQIPANGQQPGSGKATASLVLGIIGIVFWFFGWGVIISLIFGIIGIILSASAKKDGNTSGINTAGFVLSLISLIVGAIVFLACVACVGSAASISTMIS